MIPVILYLLIIGYALLIFSFIFEEKLQIIRVLSSFFLIVLSVSILTDGIGDLANTSLVIVSTGVITISLCSYCLIKDLFELDFSIKEEEEE